MLTPASQRSRLHTLTQGPRYTKIAAFLRAHEAGLFETLDAATSGLHPHLTRQSRARLRALAELVANMPTASPRPNG